MRAAGGSRAGPGRGRGASSRVELGVDGSWSDAALDAAVGPYAWRGWHADWEAAPGEHVVSCRATDSGGNVQPLEQPWTYQGMGNNLVQEVAVAVR
jgi:sulfane dehydrogenase subunit SoxC